MTKQYDIYGLGNALMDMEFQVDDSFLQRFQQEKSQMALVEADQQRAMMDALDGVTPATSPGGSAANTAIAVAGFGGKSFYSCQVADDATGRAFLDGLRSVGVDTNDHVAADGASGKCLILITPDGERTMATHLGISAALDSRVLDRDAITAAKTVYIEGYLASGESASAAGVALHELANEHGVETALTLSDASMVQFFRESMNRMLGNGVDYLFCNEEEALAWSNTDRIDVAAAELKDISPNLCITLGPKGCLLVLGSARHEVPGFPVKPLDTTGAGDVWAGAYLYAVHHGMSGIQAATLANKSASQLVSQLGARLPQDAYATLLASL